MDDGEVRDVDPDAWLLLRAGEVIAELDIDEVDQPWFLGKLLPRAGFEAVRELFDLERAQRSGAMEYDPGLYDRTNELLTLLTPYGPAAEFWLQVDGDRIALRWSDEPLPADPG